MSAPQGPGWRQGPDGRWYPPEPQYPSGPHYPPGPGPYFPPPPKSSRNWLIPVLVIVGLVVVGGGLLTWWVASKVGDAVSSVSGGTDLTCPTDTEISQLLGANVKGPTAPKIFVAAACYYEPATADDIYEVIIVSGSRIVADDEIASMKSEGEAAGASPHSISVGKKGIAWSSSTKSSAIAVGDKALVSVEVQGQNFTSIPNQEAAAVAILEKVIY